MPWMTGDFRRTGVTGAEISAPSNTPDDRNPPLHGHCLQRLAEIGAAGEFQDVVGAVIAGNLEDTLRPIFRHAVDAVIGAERPRALELVLAA